MISKSRLYFITKLFIFAFLFAFFCGFQTSFWPYFSGGFAPSPLLWLILIIFVSYKWENTTAVLFIYFLALIMTRFTYAPLKVLLISLVFVHVMTWIFKNRILTNSQFYFSVLVAISTLMFQIGYILVSVWLEPRSTHIFFFHRFIETGMTFIASFPIGLVLSAIDRFFNISEDWKKTNPANVNSSEAGLL